MHSTDGGLLQSHRKPEALCLVCGDRASGKHYGVQSCDGCRGFFKRSIRREMDVKYVCKENGQCIVDVARRNQCQACRFRKCNEVGMKKEAVQHERAPRCYQYKRESPDYSGEKRMEYPGVSPYNAASFLDRARLEHYTHFQQYSPPVGLTPDIGYHHPAIFGPLPLLRPTSTSIQPPASPTVEIKVEGKESPDESKKQNESREPKESAKKDDKSPSSTQQPSSTFPSVDAFHYSNITTENLFETAARLLFMSVKWARNIPSFLQLPFRDQAILLEESWSDLFILSAAQWSLPIDIGTLAASASTAADTSGTERASLIVGQLRSLQDVLSRFSSLRVDATEYACLKAIVLFKNVRGLRDAAQVETLQDQAQLMLSEYACSQYPNSKVRFGKILLLLPALRAVGSRTIEEVFFRKTIGSIPIERLLCDMFKSS
ncbi:DgyrCDS2975 [Dimorphilus gyrociliatus]|nr:DgyrCDS2975 [Dimorphilus gyrociliatus]